ncbi:TOBE domain-containing protein [Pseudolysinimonas kribbensis]|jgi:molybdopterin-binding protein|uniref:MerR family transcriptional regulator n=1 Tax=Pseudolysinimonas kribbensis TaxID=433641 RepID=A0ABQ6K613_9MICO|nr:TOBE domain-containing protein [Pseudolysinimonas kribbensis]GMA95045.1 MerR family transcriptional regulator [Pseudolysinimonas kribbensis]
MTRFRIAEAAALLGVSDDTVRRWGESGRLPIRHDGTRQTVEGSDLVPLLTEHPARAAMAEAFPVAATSARNRFVGLVTHVVKDGVMAQVDLQAGPFRVVSLMTREAADELGLEPGMLASASVKATNVVVELLPEG